MGVVQLDLLFLISFVCTFQDSMLEFEGPPLDPAIVSAQPMKPPQIVDLPQMVCPPGTSHWVRTGCTASSIAQVAHVGV